MALNLNFYHEQHREEYERARDPLKLASKGAVVVLVLAALYYFYRMQDASHVVKRASQLRAEWAKLEPAKKQAEAREAELLKGQETHKAVIERLQKRFLFAPMLARLQEAVDPGVQLQSFSSMMAQDGGPAVEIHLVGVAAGLQPRRAAEEFRLRLLSVLKTGYQTVLVRYDGTNSLEETSDIVQSEEGELGVARFRLRISLGEAIEVAAEEKEEEKAAAVPAEKAASFPARKIEDAKKTLEGVAKARQEIEDEVEGKKKPSAGEVARQKEKGKQ